MSVSPRWVATKDILDHPEQYPQHQLVLGSKYSLIRHIEPAVPNYSYFYGIRIHESVRLHNCLYILIHMNSLEEFNRLRDNLHVDAMSLPSISEGNLIPVDNYIVSAILPNGTQLSFSEVVRI